MDDIPPRSYGPLIETTVRVITWNVWGLYGPWQDREAAITATLPGPTTIPGPPSSGGLTQSNLRY
jgi:hypothetical protein